MRGMEEQSAAAAQCRVLIFNHINGGGGARTIVTVVNNMRFVLLSSQKSGLN